MNYKKIYQNLIDKAKSRPEPLLFEKHHVVPRCLGGSDGPENLVALTPEEHYVAHQLLIKIYPNNDSLVYAAQMMVPNRPNNKMYGWLRRRYREVCRKKVGPKNSQYGTKWVTNGKDNKKILKKDPIPDGWFMGRKMSKDFSDKMSKMLKETRPRKDRKWITNGIIKKKILVDQPIPDGWQEGTLRGLRKAEQQRSQLREQKAREQKALMRKTIALESWRRYLNGPWKSSVEFAKDNREYTRQNWLHMWKKHVPNYTAVSKRRSSIKILMESEPDRFAGPVLKTVGSPNT